LFGRDDFFVNEDICQRKVQQRSPVHSYGVFNPSVGLPSPSLQEDEVWGIDLAPIAMGSTLDPRPGPTDVSCLKQGHTRRCSVIARLSGTLSDPKPQCALY
jgi:hypothetical protein